ncbi:hypothetical protein G6F58_013637 [Rhizopus delemar]|nr:hypothetical protein G6F58_013637 [Rhizopus delemar]
MGSAPPLLTGDSDPIPWPGGYERGAQICPDDRGARPGRATAGGPGVRDADDQRRACATACGGRRCRLGRAGWG